MTETTAWRKNTRILVECLSDGTVQEATIRHVWKENGAVVKFASSWGVFDVHGDSLNWDEPYRATLPTPELEARLAYQEANPTPAMLKARASSARSSLIRTVREGLKTASTETLNEIVRLLEMSPRHWE